MTYRIQQLFMYVALAFVGLLVIMVFVDRVQASEQYECRVTMAQVTTFDTMWRIAEDNCDGNIRNAVYDMIDLNGGSPTVHPNQWIYLPSEP